MNDNTREQKLPWMEALHGSKHYTVEVSCTNCGWDGQVQVQKGTPFDNMRSCPRCECRFKLVRRA